MSKRSYRRLAAVAGTALALGSMAPAMALRLGAEGTGDVNIETIDVTDVIGGVQSSNLIPTGALLTTVGSVRTLATGTAFLAITDVQNIVGGALGSARCLVGAGTDAAFGLVAAATADAGLGVGLGGIGLGLEVGAIVGAPLALVGNATTCLAPLQTAAMSTVAHVQGAATAAGTLVTSTALSTVGSAPVLVGGVFNQVTPLLLGNLLNIGASADAGALLGLF